MAVCVVDKLDRVVTTEKNYMSSDQRSRCAQCVLVAAEPLG